MTSSLSMQFAQTLRGISRARRELERQSKNAPVWNGFPPPRFTVELVISCASSISHSLQLENRTPSIPSGRTNSCKQSDCDLSRLNLLDGLRRVNLLAEVCPALAHALRERFACGSIASMHENASGARRQGTFRAQRLVFFDGFYWWQLRHRSEWTYRVADPQRRLARSRRRRPLSSSRFHRKPQMCFLAPRRNFRQALRGLRTQRFPGR